MFQFFSLFWVILIPKKNFLNPKTSVYDIFLGCPTTYYVENKIEDSEGHG